MFGGISLFNNIDILQSGHSDVKTVLGYIQHTPSRIRKIFDKVFEKEIELPEKYSPYTENQKYLKKKTVEKYLQGELYIKALNNILQTFDYKKIKRETGDIAYR